MTDALTSSIEWLDRLVAFDTTSRLSNLELIDDVQGYLDGLGVPTRLTRNEDGTKAGTGSTVSASSISIQPHFKENVL